MMAKLEYLVFLLSIGVVLKESGALVVVPFPVESLLSFSVLNSPCTVFNESFVGWFKVNGNVKIDIVQTRSDVKIKPGVFIETSGSVKTAHLIFPKGSPVTAGGKYICKGTKNEDLLTIYVRFSLDSLQRNQSLYLGQKGKVALGALSYPLSKFKWKKDGVRIDFAADPRLTLENDGSISINNVRQSDAGRYDVNVNWENRNTADEIITVHVVRPPQFFISPLQNKTVTKGDPIRLLCNATANPAPVVSWSKADGTINPSYLSGHVLMIPRAELSDAGKYICTATNGVSSTSVEAFVTVKLRPHSPVPVGTQITHMSIKVNWRAPESHGYPVLMYSVHKVELDRAGQEVTSRTYHVNEDVHHYKFRDIEGGKSYKFYVTAWNTYGESVKNHVKSLTVKVSKP